jgi:hypothetical protein
MMPEKKAIIISYIPMVDLVTLADLKGQVIDLETDNNKKRRLNEILENIIDTIRTRGVLWSYDKDEQPGHMKLHASIVLEKGANDLYSHMEDWAEGDISKRFQWNIVKNKDIENKDDLPPEGYIFSIAADPFESIRRFKIANKIFGDSTEIEDIENYSVLSFPIETMAVTSDAVHKIIEVTGQDVFNLETEIYISLVDMSDVTNDDGSLSHDKFTQHGKTCRWMKLKRQGAIVKETTLPKPSDN